MGRVTDRELIDDYISQASNDAFAELVRRHADWVYSAALRMVRDPHDAEDVAQAVFIVLAEKAAQISPRASFTGWLFRVTRYCAHHARRTRRRREKHERKAASMRTTVLSDDPSGSWSHIEPLLEGAVAKLSIPDRTAVLLRFYQCKSMAEIGAELSITEEAAKKRVARAVQRLRRLFERQGVNLPAAAMSALLADRATASAPVELVRRMAVLSSAASARGGVSVLVHGALRMLTVAKFKPLLLLLVLVFGSMVAAMLWTAAPAHDVNLANLETSNRFVVTMPSGIDVEILGVTDGTESPARWWSADGAPIAPLELPADPNPEFAAGEPLTHRIVVRLGAQEGRVTVWSIEPMVPSEIRYDAFQQRGIVIVKLSVPTAQPILSLGATFAIAPAEVVGRMRAGQSGVVDTSSGSAVTFSAPEEAGGDTVLTVTHPFQEEHISVVAIDRRGRTIAGRTGNGSAARLPLPQFVSSAVGFPSTATTPQQWAFRAVPLTDIEEFQLRRRPFAETFMCRRLSLRPGTRTVVEVVSCVGPPSRLPADQRE